MIVRTWRGRARYKEIDSIFALHEIVSTGPHKKEMWPHVALSERHRTLVSYQENSLSQRKRTRPKN